LDNWFKLLDPDFSWGLYGHSGYHIDHVIPVKSFDLSNKDEFNKCFHWSNLQPLIAKSNLLKGCIFDNELIKSHHKKYIEFTTTNLSDIN
jgi:hypothetical protein